MLPDCLFLLGIPKNPVRTLVSVMLVLFLCLVTGQGSGVAAPPSVQSLLPPIVRNHGQEADTVGLIANGPERAVYFTSDSIRVVSRRFGTSTSNPSIFDLAVNKPQKRNFQGVELIADSIFEFLAKRRQPEKPSSDYPWSSTLEQADVLSVRFLGASKDAGMKGAGKVLGKAHYLHGISRSRWTNGAPIFDGVEYTDLWPGVNIAITRAEDRVYTTVVFARGADIDMAKWRYEGAESVSVARSGDLIVRTHTGEFIVRKPTAVQGRDGKVVNLNGRFTVDSGTVRLCVEGMDDSLSLIVTIADGVLSDALCKGWDLTPGQRVTASQKQSRYVTGSLYAPRFSTVFHGTCFACPEANLDSFVARVSASGSPSYFTIIGGSQGDEGSAVAVDASGAAYAIGYTRSHDFPTTPNALGCRYNLRQDFFSARLSPSGDALLYSTYLGEGGGCLRQIPSGEDAARSVSSTRQRKMIAIVVDDVSSEKQVRPFLDLHTPLTFALFPDAGDACARSIRTAGCCPILHMLLEALDLKTDPSAICESRGRTGIQSLLEQWLTRMPSVMGASNHEGSKATSDPETMAAVLEVLKEHNLLFFDSRTAPTTIAVNVASSMGVPALQQDMFLDGSKDPGKIAAFLHALAGLSETTGYAIGICHATRPDTPVGLSMAIPALVAEGFEFVTLPDLVAASR